MIDYNKVKEYIADMSLTTGSCAQLTSVALDDLFGSKTSIISERDLHDGIEFILARCKKDVEENSCATQAQKEQEKDSMELILKSLEDQIRVYLKSQNRLLRNRGVDSI